MSAWVCRIGVMIVLLARGCGPRSRTVPVSGRLLMQGRPLPEAVVRFVGEAGEPPLTHPPNGVTDAEGRFQLSYAQRHDGAPPGRYKMTVVLQATDGEGSRRGRNLLPVRYAEPATTPLSAVVSSVGGDLGDFTLEPR